MTMTRIDFLRTLAGAGAAALGTSVLLACGSDDEDDDGGGDPNCAANGTRATIGANHGHALTVAMADVTAAVEKSYDIRGSSDHPHTVTITAAQFATLATNNSLQVSSSSDAGHTHTITVTCA
jgi:hypothetical protein